MRGPQAAPGRSSRVRRRLGKLGRPFGDNARTGWFGGNAQQEGRPDAEEVFGDVFEDMLRPEVQRVMPFWKYVGAASGAAIGFIVGNLPGAAIGGYGGSKLGAVRDAKGKAVYECIASGIGLAWPS
jgi:hypothetical protein